MGVRKKRRVLSSLIVATIIMLSSFGTAFAASVYEDFVNDRGYSSSASVEVIEDVLSNGQAYGFSKGDLDKIKKDFDKYKEDPENNKSYLIKAGNKVSNIAKRSVVDSKIDDMGIGFNVSANVEQAGVALSGVEEFASLVTGLLVYAVTIGMTVFTAIDVCYITIPVFRNKCEDAKQSGGMMAKTNSQTGETKFRFVTDEAIYAVIACSIESGKHPLWAYLGKRIWAFVLLGIVLSILLTDNIQLIANIALNVVAGFVEALSNLGS